MEGSTEGMLFASFSETNISSLMNIQETHIIPTDSDFFKINGRNDIIAVSYTHLTLPTILRV